MLTRHTPNRPVLPKHRPGFTLVEMLVVVALVLIMMSMFANIFFTLTTSLSLQRGIAENDQRGRLLSVTLRGDLDRRTFRDVIPFRANEDTRALGHSLARRAGYFEIDEGDPNSDIDDVLQFTASVNIQLQSKDATPYLGNVPSTPLSLITTATATGNTLSIPGNYVNQIAMLSRLWIAGAPYYVTAAPVYSGVTSTTTVTVNQTIAASGNVLLSENEPDFDDGVFGNSVGSSAYAEICYFLRNGRLYRRVLLIRDKQPGADSQPTYSGGQPLLWNLYTAGTENYAPVGPPPSTFWRDFDYSAFYYTGNNSGLAPGVRFHNATQSLSNSSQGLQMFTNTTYEPTTNFPFSLGIPNWRFGHSNSTGLPQDLSTTATLSTNGATVTIGRYNLQECSDNTFGYPGWLPPDPISGTANVNPFDRQNVSVDPSTGLVIEYTSKTNNTIDTAVNLNRRGADLLMSNVLTFDVKVWDPVDNAFVDIGNSQSTTGVFSATPAGSANGIVTDVNGNIVGGRLNSPYCGVAQGIAAGATGYYRFDTWHPNAFTGSTTLYSAQPHLTSGGVTPTYYYTEPPYLPYQANASTNFSSAALTAIQIRINYRDVSSNQIRQMTIVQSLVDRLKLPSVTNEGPEE